MTLDEQQTINWVEHKANEGSLFSQDLQWARDHLADAPEPRDPVVQEKIGDWSYLLDIGAFPVQEGRSGAITTVEPSGGPGGGILADITGGMSPTVLVGVGLALLWFLGRKK